MSAPRNKEESQACLHVPDNSLTVSPLYQVTWKNNSFSRVLSSDRPLNKSNRKLHPSGPWPVWAAQDVQVCSMLHLGGMVLHGACARKHESCTNIAVPGKVVFSYAYCWCEEQTLVSFSSSSTLSSLAEFLTVVTGLGTAVFHFLSELKQSKFYPKY